MISILQGFWRYVLTVRRTGTYGRIRFTHKSNDQNPHASHGLLKHITNLAIIILSTFLIVFGTIEPIQSLFIGRVYPLNEMIVDGLAQFHNLAAQALSVLLHGINQINHFNAQLIDYVAIVTFLFFATIIRKPNRIRHLLRRMMGLLISLSSNRQFFTEDERQTRSLKHVKRELMRVERQIELNPGAVGLFIQ